MLVLILFLALPVFAQNKAPEWIDESWQANRYPKSEWYTGFAKDKINWQPGSNDYQAIEKNAQNKLSESIIVMVQGSSSVRVYSTQTQKGETINTNYSQNIKTASNIVLVKVDVKSYFDKKSGYIYGFAAVKKKDLADFYRSNINSLFAFADKEFIRAEALAEQGKKNLAFRQIQSIEDSLKNVAYWGNLLQMTENDNSYINREHDFWQKINEAKKNLEYGTTVYLDVSGIADSEYLAEKVGALMQEKGCNCAMAEENENADYSVAIKIRLNRCSEASPSNPIFCWVSATAVVNNLKHKKNVNVKIPDAKGGWIKGNKERAIEEAFKKLTNSLAEKINQTINQ